MTSKIPNNEALPEPYLSDKAPKRGEPIPIIKTCNAAPKLNTSHPVLRKFEIGRRYKPNECLNPNEINNKTLPPIITNRGIKLLFDVSFT